MYPFELAVNQMFPALSATTPCGAARAVGNGNSWNSPVRGSSPAELVRDLLGDPQRTVGRDGGGRAVERSARRDDGHRLRQAQRRPLEVDHETVVDSEPR